MQRVSKGVIILYLPLISAGHCFYTTLSVASFFLSFLKYLQKQLKKKKIYAQQIVSDFWIIERPFETPHLMHPISCPKMDAVADKSATVQWLTAVFCVSCVQGEPGKSGEKGLGGAPGLRVSYCSINVSKAAAETSQPG